MPNLLHINIIVAISTNPDMLSENLQPTILPQGYRTGPGHDLAGIVLHLTSFLCPSRRWGRGEPGELATKQKRRFLEKISGQLEVSFLNFLTLGSIKHSNTHSGGASDIVKTESSGEDPRVTRGLVSNRPHPRVN